MSTNPDEPQDTVPDGSVWSQLRAEHEALTHERDPLDLDVPGYTGLQIRFQFVPLADTEKTTAKLAKIKSRTEQALFGAMDTLIMACDEFRVMRPGDPRADAKGYAPLAEPGEAPMRFDRVLAAGLDLPNAGTLGARQIVHHVFGGEQGHYLILDMAREVSEWMAGTREDVAEEFSGN